MTAWICWEGGIELERPKMEEHSLRRVFVDGSMTLDQLDPLAFSELVNDVESLR